MLPHVKPDIGFKYRIIVCNQDGICDYANCPTPDMLQPIASTLILRVVDREKLRGKED